MSDEPKILSLIEDLKEAPIHKKENLIEECLMELRKEEAPIYFKEMAKAAKVPIAYIRERFKKLWEWKANEDCNQTKNKKNLDLGELDDNFYRPDLLRCVHEEIHQKHKHDVKARMTAFLVRTSAQLPRPEDHASNAIKGNSSAGKDNMVKAALSLFPEEDNLELTRGTQASLEEEVNNIKCVFLSEMNYDRENGANIYLVEFVKQISAGGSNVLKKNPLSFNNTRIKAPQKTVFFSTTAERTDEELATRFITTTSESSYEKNKTVVEDILTKAGKPTNDDGEENWFTKGIRQLDDNLDVLIPYAVALKQPVTTNNSKYQHVFDYTDDRVKRDVKRMLSLTKAVAWLHQHQRQIKEIDGKRYVISEPTDFITVFEITNDFFILTAMGLDQRIKNTFEMLKKLVGQHTEEIKNRGFNEKFFDWVIRSELQKEVKIKTAYTIKEHIKLLKERGLVETHYEKENSTTILVRPIISPINNPSAPISTQVIDGLLTSWLTKENKNFWYGEKELIPLEWLFTSPEESLVLEEKDSSKVTDRSTVDGSKLTNFCPSSNSKNLTTQILELLSDNEPLAVEDIKKSLKLSNEEVISKIESMMREGLIYEPKQGLYMRI